MNEGRKRKRFLLYIRKGGRCVSMVGSDFRRGPFGDERRVSVVEGRRSERWVSLRAAKRNSGKVGPPP